MRVVAVVLFLLTLFTMAYSQNEQENLVKVKGIVEVYGDIKGKGMVSFFNKSYGPKPNPEYFMRIPDYVFELKPDGSFQGEILRGEYLIGVNFNDTGKRKPLNVGDYYHILKETFRFQEKVNDIGVIKISPVKLETFKVKTAIKGVVLDEKGKPVPDVYVFAFLKEQKTKRPLFISEKTDKEGRFLLRLGGEGIYYLKVRDLIDRGKPKKDSIIGIYGEPDKPETIEIKDGEIKDNVKIRVTTYSKLVKKAPSN